MFTVPHLTSLTVYNTHAQVAVNDVTFDTVTNTTAACMMLLNTGTAPIIAINSFLNEISPLTLPRLLVNSRHWPDSYQILFSNHAASSSDHLALKTTHNCRPSTHTDKAITTQKFISRREGGSVFSHHFLLPPFSLLSPPP